MKKTYLFTSIMLLSILSYAQQAVIGNITDSFNNKPLEGVIIKVKDTYVSTQSDANGNYSIEIPEGSKTLTFEKEGYSVNEITIASNIVNVKMTSTVDDLFDLTLEELMNLQVVTSSKKEETALETPAYVVVLTEKEIATLNFNSLKEIIDYVVGMQTVTAKGNIFTNTAVRGNASSNFETNNLLLFNGIPIYEHMLEDFEYGLIPLSSIKQIEIVKGSNSVLYGTNAMNAVINIIPKESEENGTVFSGKIRYGSFNTIVGQNAVAGARNDLKFGVFTDFSATKGEELTYLSEKDGSTFALKNRLKKGAVGAYLKYKGLKLDVLSFNKRLNHVNNNNLDSLTFQTGNNVRTKAYLFDSEISHNLISLSYTKDISDNLNLHLRSCYQENYFNRAYQGQQLNTNSSGSFNEAELTWTQSDKFDIKLGFHYDFYIASGALERIQNNTFQEIAFVDEDEIPTQNFAVYLNGSYEFIERLKLHYGGRYYMSEYDGNITDNLSPRLALTYSFTDDYILKAIYGKSFRVPGYVEKSSALPHVYGNPKLNPQTSTTYDLVFSGKLNNLIFDIDVFYFALENNIGRGTPTQDELDLYGENLTLIHRNVGEAEFYGAELNGKFFFSDNFSGFFGYAYAIGNNPDDDPDTIIDDIWNFEHLFNIGIGYRPFDFMQITASNKVISEWGPAPENVVLNLGLNIYPLKDQSLSVELKTDNVFNENVYMPDIVNRKVDTAPYNPKTEERSYYIGLSYRF